MKDLGTDKATLFVGSRDEVSNTIESAYAHGLAEGRAQGIEEVAKIINRYGFHSSVAKFITVLNERAAEIREEQNND